MSNRIITGTCFLYVDGNTRVARWAVNDSDYDNQDGTWSHEGLHFLENGDILRVISPDNPEEVLWEGKIRLCERPFYTPEECSGDTIIDSYHCKVDPDDWIKWFCHRYPVKFRRVGR